MVLAPADAPLRATFDDPARSSGPDRGDYRDITYETAEGIAKITINRPEVRNAFRPQTLFELADAFDARPRRPDGRRRSS